MGRAEMSRSVDVVLLPLTLVAAGIGMALTRDEPMWLVFAAVLAIATSFMARRTSGR